MREKIYSALNNIQIMNKKYEFKTLGNKIESIQKSTGEFALKVLFVGEFSAGKSALINTIIGKELLKEGQRPETAIASEIRYDTNEFIEAVCGKVKKRYEIENAELIDTTQYDFLIWHLNCEELMEYGECTLVDMPGFNSGIQNHNKAILQYAGKGNAYILVIDCEDGAIKQNIHSFIDEIKNYENNMAIIITKTDLKISEDIERIKENIAINAEQMFESNVPIVATSKYDDDAKNKLRSLIHGFDRENIFIQEFAPQVYEIGVRCIDSMEIFKRSQKLDLSQFDIEISKHEKTKRELASKLKNEKGKLESRFRNSVGPAIIADVQNALYSRVEELASSLKAGEKSFSMTINNILRPVLLASTQQYVEQSFDKFITGIDFSDIDLDVSIQEISINALEKYQQVNGKMQEIAGNSEKFNTVYKTIATTLAVATNVIAPWLELIIIFLPNILKLFGMGNKEDSIKNRINNEVIPQIVNRIQPEIEKSLMEMKEDMLRQAEEEIIGLIDNEMESLEVAKANKEKCNSEYENKMKEIQSDIETVRKIIDEIA